jgi:hypothetical protein
MTDELPLDLVELLGNIDGQLAEEKFIAVIVYLEKSARMQPETIAKAMARALLGYCADHSKDEKFLGWWYTVVYAVGAEMRKRITNRRRKWVETFMVKHARLYEVASEQIVIRSDKRKQMDDYDLYQSNPHGQG